MYAAGVEGQALVTVEDSYLPPQPPGPSPLQPRLNPDTASALRDASRRGSIVIHVLLNLGHIEGTGNMRGWDWS